MTKSSRLLVFLVGAVILLATGFGPSRPKEVVAAKASVNFPDVIRYKAGHGARAVLVADVNGDRTLDLVTSNAAGQSISVFAGYGNGTFRDSTPIPTPGKTPYALAAGRFNADGHPDVATVDLASGTTTVFANDGNGGFAPLTSLQVGGGPVSVDAADLNGDGFDDLVDVNLATSSVDLFLNASGKGFGAKESVPTGGLSPRGLVIADLNRDGRKDLAVANSRSSNISLLVNQGGGRYGAAATYQTAAGPESICAADFDGDGSIDIATASPAAGKVSLLRGLGDGTLAAARHYEARSPQTIRAADMNQDGAVDLVVSQPDRDSVAVLLNEGRGSFSTPFELPVGGLHPTSVSAADIDKDGNVDLVAVNEGSSDVSVLLHGVPSPHVDRFSPGPAVRVSQTDGRLDQPITASFNTTLDRRTLTSRTILLYAVQSGFHDARIAYSPTDHLVTIEPDAASPFRPGETVTVLFTSGIRSERGIPMGRGVSHTFTVQPQKGSGQFVELERIKCDKIPGTLKAADFNRDGRMDIVALCREVDGIRVHMNRGNAKFDFDHHLFLKTGGYGPWDLVPADLDNDGLIDIAVVNTFSSNMALFKNVGDGTFKAPIVLPCGAGPMGIAAGDMNGDGFMDLAAAAKGFPEVLVFMNKATGELAFDKPVRYAVAPSPYSVSVRDIDNDGAPDLVMTNLESDRGTFLINRGDGTFRTPEEFSLVLAKAIVDDPIDVDADGKTDIVTVNTASDDISVLLNTGDKGFSARKNIPVGLTPTDQVFGDFNSDGYVDIALTLDGGNVVIMMNKRDGTFERAGVVAVGRNPTSPVSADFNGDGTLDLVIANQYSYDISVLVNLPGKPAATGGKQQQE